MVNILKCWLQYKIIWASFVYSINMNNFFPELNIHGKLLYLCS